MAAVANNAKTTKKLGGVTGKGFMPGKSGNPSGRPKKKPLTEAYERALDNPVVADAIAKAMIRAARKGNVRAAIELADRLEGKVKLDVNASLTGLEELPEILNRARRRAANGEQRSQPTTA